jgi:hypothetical protein
VVLVLQHRWHHLQLLNIL